LVPRLVRFNGNIKDTEGNPLTGVITATFSFYSEQTGGAALWQETQNLTTDSSGQYLALLGSTQPQGLPMGLFTSGEARWLGVRPQGMTEQARVLLVSAPYALKAEDAETLGGFPPSAFVLATPSSSNIYVQPPADSSSFPSSPPPAGSVSGSGTTDFIPLWTSPSNLGNSVLFQSGSGSTAKIGVNTTTPAATLDVKGATTIRGTLQLPSKGTATASTGFISQPLNLQGSSFNSITGKAVSQAFQWQAEPSGNDTSSPSATLNLRFGSGGSNPTETGLNISSKGLFTFAAGQRFPGTGTITGVTTANGSGLTGGGISGNLTLSLLQSCSTAQVLQWNGSAWACAKAGTGTITGVTAGTDLTGGGTNGNVTLNLNTSSTDARYAQLAVTNTFAAGQNILGGISATGTIAGLTGTFNATTSAVALNVTQNGPGTGLQSAGATPLAILGWSTATGGNTYGVYGLADKVAGTGVAGQGLYGVLGNSYNANGAGVLGASSSSTGVAVLGTNTAGGWGGYFSSSNVATYAYSRNESLEKASVTAPGVGVWGDTGQAGGYAGVAGTADDGNAGVFYNNSPSGWTTLYAQSDESFNSGNHIIEAFGSAFGGRCYIDVSGNLVCTGSKSAVVPVDGGARKVALYAVESPENWFEDFGSGTLTNGVARIALESTFSQTVNTGVDYHVFLTPNGECNGLSVRQKTAGSFEVRELAGGHSDVEFDYRIVARRKGYENIRLADKTKQLESPMVAGRKPVERQWPARPTTPRVPRPTELPIHSPMARAVPNRSAQTLK
jgi:hypothetical protein